MDPNENGNLPITRSAYLPGNGKSIPVFGAGGEVVAWMEPFGGLTKREHFAAMAMQGRLGYVMDTNPSFQHGRMEDVARMSVEMADALLRALAAGGEGC